MSGLMACLRCGHGNGVHKTARGRYDPALKNSAGAGPCLDCACPKWVQGKCGVCGEFKFSWGSGECGSCQRKRWKQIEEAMNRPEAVAERQRYSEWRNQQRWLRQGRRTLTDLRQLLRHEARSSARQASKPARTSLG